MRETETRLARLGLSPADLVGVLVTHEHDDHIGGVAAFVAKHSLKAWMTYGTLRAGLEAGLALSAHAIVIDSHDAFLIDALEVHPITVPHDAREPVQYCLSDGSRKLGVLTDTGAPTRHISAKLADCDALVLECNHDPSLLAKGPYPAFLKARVGGDYGHLANAQAAAILASLDCSRLQHVIAAHLSTTNNRAELAQAALAVVLGCEAREVGVASQINGFDWRSIHG